MQGVSTKVAAATTAAWIVSILTWILTSASFGPQWAPFPAEITAAFIGLVTIIVGYLVPEKAPNS